jgi:hypothetical protein
LLDRPAEPDMLNTDSPPRVAFLLGAGASKDAGLPLAVELFDRLQTSFDDSLAHAADDRARDRTILEASLWDYVRTRMRAVDRPAFDAGNFEAVVEALETLRNAMTHPLMPFVDWWHRGLDAYCPRGIAFGSAYTDLWSKLNRPFDRGAWIAYGPGGMTPSESEVMDRLSYRIRSGVRRWVHREFENGDLDYLAELATLARGRQVFTLNYDLALETAAEAAGVSISTGFTYQTQPYPFPPHQIVRGVWNPNSFDSVAATGVRLYKLHGSIDWYADRTSAGSSRVFSARRADLTPQQLDDLDGSESLRQVSEHGPDPMLFAATGKLPSYEPFLTLYQRFVSAINDLDILVIIGCQWQSEPVVADTIAAAVQRRNHPLRLIEVTFGPEAEAESESRLLRGARDEILSGRLTTAIARASEAASHMRRMTSMIADWGD